MGGVVRGGLVWGMGMAHGVGAGGGDIRGREPDEGQEHADDRDMDFLLRGPRVRPAGAGAVAPSPAALRSAGPVHAWQEHRIYPAYLAGGALPVFGAEKAESDHRPPGSLPNTKKGQRKPHVEYGAALNVRTAVYVMCYTSPGTQAAFARALSRETQVHESPTDWVVMRQKFMGTSAIVRKVFEKTSYF